MLFKDTEIFLESPNDEWLRYVNPGSYHRDVVEFKANKAYNYWIYTTWGENDNMPKDWSLVTWSDKQEIEIKHAGGFESKSFFNVDLDANMTLPQNFTDNGKADHRKFGPLEINGEQIVQKFQNSSSLFDLKVGNQTEAYFNEHISRIYDGFDQKLEAFDGSIKATMNVTSLFKHRTLALLL